MKLTQVLMTAALLATPMKAMAEDTASAAKGYAPKETTCKQGQAMRKVKVDFKDVSSGSDCSVSYQKENEQAEKVLWSAQRQPDFCQEKATAFVEKLKGMGYTCE